MRLHRRELLAGGLAVAALPAGPGWAAAQPAGIALPPPITAAERLQRLAKARALMQRHGLGAVLIEPGASLDYFTGVRWSRSERLTATVIPATGEPIIVTPFFEKPSVAESLAIPAEIRTWDEHEEPLKLVAAFLKERKLANIARVRPDVVATGNVGCIRQLAAPAAAPILHTVELLDWATGGPLPPALARRGIGMNTRPAAAAE